MLKIIFLIIIFFVSAFSIDFNPKLLQSIIKDNPNAEQEKLLLASYFFKHHNNTKALVLLDDILKKNSKNLEAKKLKDNVETQINFKKLLLKLHLKYPPNMDEITEYLDSLYQKKEYNEYIVLYESLINLKLIQPEKNHLYAANIYFLESKYGLSSFSLSHLHTKYKSEKLQIEAKICFSKEQYNCALDKFIRLYNKKPSLDYGLKIIESYLFLNDVDKAKEFYLELLSKYSESNELHQLFIKLAKKEKRRLEIAKIQYEKEKNLKSLTAYCSILYHSGLQQKSLEVLHQYNKKYETKESLVLEAKYLSWTGKIKESIEILEKLETPSDYTIKFLIGQISSWDNDQFEKSKHYLNDVIEHVKDEKLIYSAKKALAFVYKWHNKKKKAREIFSQLIQKDPNDVEVEEALMELKGEYITLIKRYEEKVRLHIDFLESKKRLVEFYLLNNQSEKAIALLKQSLIEFPNNFDLHRRLGSILIEKREYYLGFHHLEIDAKERGSVDALLSLAKKYYKYGFSKESMETVVYLLKKYPQNQEALVFKNRLEEEKKEFFTIYQPKKSSIKEVLKKEKAKYLELADTLYDEGHYASSLLYYQNYLSLNPTNSKVRLRYAYALEYSAFYDKASGEFYLLQKVYNNEEIEYHYAYNLMMSKKLDKAKVILKKLKRESYLYLDKHKKEFSGAQKLLLNWKKALKSLDYKQYCNQYSKALQENEEWTLRQKDFFKKTSSLNIDIQDVLIKKNQNKNSYTMKFYEVVTTNNVRYKGYKTFDIECSLDNRECHIVNEYFKDTKYQQYISLRPLINQALKDIKYFKKGTNLSSGFAKRKKKVLSIGIKYKDIILPGLKKNFLKSKEIFDSISGNIESIESYLKGPFLVKIHEPLRKSSSLSSIYFNDDDSEFYSVGLRTDHFHLNEKIDFSLDLSKYYISERDGVNFNGWQYGLSLYYKHFSLRLGGNQNKVFSEFIPSITYQNSYKRHNYQVKISYENALFSTYKTDVIEQKIKVTHLEFSDYAMFRDKTSLWASLAVNHYSNSDLEITGQFDWRFYHHEDKTHKFLYDFALEGWYTAHTKQTEYYYSPKFSDSTLVRLNTKYLFSEKINVEANMGLGYSFEEKNTPYKYGVNISGNFDKDFSYHVGVEYQSSVRADSDVSYDYITGTFGLEYQW